MEIDTLLAKLHGVQKRRPGEWQARCPAHDDDKPSLSITQASSGKVLLHCHAKCTTETILDRLELKWEDLFPNTRGNGHVPRPSGRRIVATYDYRDAAGQLLYQSVRYDPKDFSQRRYDGNGAWTWKMTGVERVVYRLPELLAADAAAWIFIPEGEKDCNNLARLGLVATTNVGGTGKWYNEYAECLRDRRVCVLPDNDGSGIEHARDVAANLRGVASDVRILLLPDLKPKGDVSDWLAAGGDAATLLTLAEAAPAEIAAPTAQAEPKKNRAPKSGDFIQLLTEMGYTFRLNACSDEIEVNSKPITDVVRAEIRTKMRDAKYSRHLAAIEDAYITEAARNAYHPVQDYLNTLTYDGGQWITTLTEFFKDAHKVFPTYLRRWLIGSVAKAFTGAQNAMLVLDGPQDIGKSHFAQWLCSPLAHLFVDAAIDPADKDCEVLLISKWVWEVSELGATTRRADRESLKSFISKVVVTVRKPYGHYPLVKPALASFIGTLNNESGILSDPTGNRRFNACSLVKIDWNYIELNVHDIWAEAVALYHAGEPWRLTPKESRRAAKVNEEFMAEDPVEGLLRKHFDLTPASDTDWMRTADILNILQVNGLQGNTRANQMALSATMKRLEMKRDRFNLAWGYYGIRKPKVE